MAEELMQNIQWFPGHMTKTRRMIAANLSLVDAVVEILDARIPRSSRNPEMDRMVGTKPRLLREHPAGFRRTARKTVWRWRWTAEAERESPDLHRQCASSFCGNCWKNGRRTA